jgi:hypothetical protein
MWEADLHGALRRWCVATGVVAAAVAVAVVVVHVQGDRIIYSAGSFHNVLAVGAGDGAVVADTTTDGSNVDAPSELWAVSTNGKKSDLGAIAVAGCPAIAVRVMRRLPAAELGVIATCLDSENETGYYLTVDLPSLHVAEAIKLAADVSDVVAQASTGSGWATHFTLDCTWIERAAAPDPGAPPQNWPTGSPDVPVPSISCARQWQSRVVALTADGHKLYFAAAHNVSADEADRSGGWGFYCFDDVAGTVTEVATGFARVTGIDVNSDASAVVISADRGSRRGLWFVNVSDGRVRKVADGLLTWPSFTSDSSAVVAVDFHDIKMVKVPSLDG